MVQTRGELLKKKLKHYYDNKERYSINNRKWVQSHKKKRKKYQKEYAVKYRINNKDSIKKYKSDYYKENKEEHYKKSRKYIKQHPEKANKYLRKYRSNNKLKVAFWKHKHRERYRNIVHNFTQMEWLEKLQLTKGVCPMCNKFVGIPKLTLHHINPISKVKAGHIYTIKGVKPLCRRCNSKINDKY